MAGLPLHMEKLAPFSFQKLRDTRQKARKGNISHTVRKVQENSLKHMSAGVRRQAGGD